MEIQDLSRNPPSRTPFSEAAQRTSRRGEGRLLPGKRANKRGETKGKNKKKKERKERKKGDGETNRGGRRGKEKEVERAASRGNWANSR